MIRLKTPTVHRRLAGAVSVVLFVIGSTVATPRPANAQVSLAYAAIPRRGTFTVAILPGDRRTIGELVEFRQVNPNSAVLLATATADGGVRLNNTASVTSLRLGDLLATGVTATADGTVTLVVDAQVGQGTSLIPSRLVVVLSIKSIPSRVRMTPKASPLRMAKGVSYRLRDLVDYERLSDFYQFYDYGFERSGGVSCQNKLIVVATCRSLQVLPYPGQTTELLLNERFVATASGRLTVILAFYGSVLGTQFERLPIDVEVVG
jgi:hypothetical protein